MRKNILLVLLIGYLLAICPILAKEKAKMELDVAKIESITGVKGVIDSEEQVLTLQVPMEEEIVIWDEKLPTFAGLSTWVAFKKVNKKTMVTGDLILLPDQVNAVMKEVLNHGLEVTALHNHFLWENPRIMFMHIEGLGNMDQLANAIKKVFVAMDSSLKVESSKVRERGEVAQEEVDPAVLDGILGLKGTVKDGVYKVVIGRKAKVEDYKIGKAMGINTWAAFSNAKNGIRIDGDFALREKELQKVLSILLKANIHITSIHQHMMNAKPQYFFVHFYAIGKMEALADAFRNALEVMKKTDI